MQNSQDMNLTLPDNLIFRENVIITPSKFYIHHQLNNNKDKIVKMKITSARLFHSDNERKYIFQR